MADGIDAEIAGLLKTGGEAKKDKKKISADTELSTRSLNNELGDLLLRLAQSKPALLTVKEAANDIALLDPQLAESIFDISNHWNIVERIVYSIADKQNISLVGRIGEKIEVNRRLFDMARDGQANYRFGKVVRPAIVINTKEGKSQVAKKGIVKEFEE